MRLKRIIQFITFIHEIHHIKYSYGWWSPLFPFVGYFPEYAKRIRQDHSRHDLGPIHIVRPWHFHNCAWTGVY